MAGWRIVFLLESASGLWGGVKNALEAANGLHRRGHDVTVVALTGPPTWMELECGFLTIDRLDAECIPPCDLVVATMWTTIAPAVLGPGVAVHYCQGNEVEMDHFAELRQHVQSVYELPIPKLAVTPRLEASLRNLAPESVIHTVGNGIDHAIMYPPNADDRARRAARPRRRIGLVGPHEIALKQIPVALAAVDLASRAGLDLELVRISNTERHAAESDLAFPVEFHERVPPRAMGDLYRSMDVLLGPSGPEEGFYLPAIEAMACGVPCVLTDIPATREYADDIDGYALFVPVGDVAAMAEALVLAAGVPSVADGLREHGLAVARRFDIDRHIDAIESALQEALATESVKAHPDAGPAAGDDLRNPMAWSAALTRQAAHLVDGADAHALAACLHAASILDRTDERLRDAAIQAALSIGDARAVEYLVDDAEASGRLPGELAIARAQLAFAREDYAGCVQAFEQAVAHAPTDPGLHNDLGVAHYRAGRLGDARTAFERALAIDPDQSDARANLVAMTPTPAT